MWLWKLKAMLKTHQFNWRIFNDQGTRWGAVHIWHDNKWFLCKCLSNWFKLQWEELCCDVKWFYNRYTDQLLLHTRILHSLSTSLHGHDIGYLKQTSLTTLNINSKEWPLLRSNSHWAAVCKKFPTIHRIKKLHYPVHKSPLLTLALIQINLSIIPPIQFL